MTDRRPLEMTQVQQTVNTVQGSGGGFLELNHIDLDPSWSLLLEVQERQVCSLVYTSLWRVHWGKEESKSHNSLFLLYNDIMSCQSETKSLNITNRVNRRPHGIALQLPTSSNNRFIQEKDGGTMWVCVCVCIQGQGVTLAAHAINILQKQRKHFFFFLNFDQEISVEKKTEANQLLMRLHVPGFNCENMLRWHTYTFTKAHTHINHMCSCMFPYITWKPEHTHTHTQLQIISPLPTAVISN